MTTTYKSNNYQTWRDDMNTALSPKYGCKSFSEREDGKTSSFQHIRQDLNQSTRAERRRALKPAALKRVEESEWVTLERKSQDDWRRFLEKWKDSFQDIPVNEAEKNVNPGDHLYCHRIYGCIRYTHHMLCISVNGDDIEVTEYNGPWFGFSAAIQSFVFKCGPCTKAKIMTRVFSYEQLTTQRARKIVWPEELQRFTVNDVIAHAKQSIGQGGYSIFHKNCEHFVISCKCGLSTSLQVKLWMKVLCDFVKGTLHSGKHSVVNFVVKEGIIPKLVQQGEFFSHPISPLGIVIGAVLEALFLAYNIYQLNKMKDSISSYEYNKNLAIICSKAVSRVALGVAGTLLGLVLFGPVGALVGGAIGTFVGHFNGLLFEWGIAADVDEKIVKVVMRIIRAFKTAVTKIWSALKNLSKKN